MTILILLELGIETVVACRLTAAAFFDQRYCWSGEFAGSNPSSNFWQRYLVVTREFCDEMASLSVEQNELGKQYI